jgi:hypothetical protein
MSSSNQPGEEVDLEFQQFDKIQDNRLENINLDEPDDGFDFLIKKKRFICWNDNWRTDW